MRNTAAQTALFAILVVATLFTSGCTSQPTIDHTDSLLADTDLIYGAALFGNTDANSHSDVYQETIRAYPSVDRVLEISPEMAAFTSGIMRRGWAAEDRARRLVRMMINAGMFSEGYYTEHTRIASEVFRKHSGNCLSYTNLFVAMARHIGLDARYQMAHIPTPGSAERGYLVRTRHINVQIRDLATPASDWVTVDFNKVANAPFYPHGVVSDEYAISTFYNNLAIDELYKTNYRAAVALLAKAITIDPANGDAWVNLGAVYSKNNKFNEAMRSYEIALRADPGNESAASGLQRLLRESGQQARADAIVNDLRLRRERNPYYHFALAQAAHERQSLSKGLKHVNQAITLRKNVGAFYYLRGLLEYNLGDLAAAQASLAEAQQRKRSVPPAKQQQMLQLATEVNRAIAESPPLPQ